MGGGSVDQLGKFGNCERKSEISIVGSGEGTGYHEMAGSGTGEGGDDCHSTVGSGTLGSDGRDPAKRSSRESDQLLVV